MNVVIVDTGCANVASVKYAIQRLGYEPTVSAEHDVIRAADKVLLPGVGSAGEAMKNLAERDLISFIPTLTQPVLGICLGMQLLAEWSDESHVDMLQVIPGTVKAMHGEDGLRLPHMGWNSITPVGINPLFKGIPTGTYFYFVHSFCLPVTDNVTAASCEYGDIFSAAVCKENFYGVQFHPERSASAGALLLKNFLELTE
ncbi:imidazole glycerol phosphate synthase subunit HisH [Echinimonas agarilytica]|uniref:Imidazole glycerol phosphate synthase subunit HisH n=1 Tax=Echinimonas agarilytica TaxID=1215918 RepID=A0AA42B727_9GAMM|nr:imidazole glycerol phosphate synthase subunit HisH [Echinimonas agarilytica]MCM2679419.1 imidazole glycerol phosphate synthase subunit HisH [Echinimonas agarilytica]